MGARLLSSAVPSSIDPPSALPPAAWAPARLLGPARALLQIGTMTPEEALALVVMYTSQFIKSVGIGCVPSCYGISCCCV